MIDRLEADISPSRCVHATQKFSCVLTPTYNYVSARSYGICFFPHFTGLPQPWLLYVIVWPDRLISHIQTPPPAWVHRSQLFSKLARWITVVSHFLTDSSRFEPWEAKCLSSLPTVHSHPLTGPLCPCPTHLMSISSYGWHLPTSRWSGGLCLSCCHRSYGECCFQDAGCMFSLRKARHRISSTPQVTATK